MTVINDGGSHVYHCLRELCRRMYTRDRTTTLGLKTINNGMCATIKARADQKFTFGSEVKLENLRITNVGGIQFGHSENNIQTFTVDCYANIVNFRGSIPSGVS